MSEGKSPAAGQFAVGQVVHHKRYGYRGVIFDYDPICRADEAWYKNNQTQPGRDQPWYHVLVHDHQNTTYVAQSNLEPDATGEPIVHPLLERFFDSYVAGFYQRNNLN